MGSVSYVSLSKATALERSMNMTAHNLANSSTSGYKSMKPLLETVDSPSQGENVSFVNDSGSYLDMSKGTLLPTGNPLDLAIAGEGWFSFQLVQGGTGYGRHGQLAVDAEGQVRTSAGHTLLDAGGGPIVLPAEAGSNVSIASDGTIVDEGGAVLGIVGVFDIPGGADMTPLGGGTYALPPDTPVPEPSEVPGIMQGFVETSNVQAVVEMTRLIDIQRAYENAITLMNEDDKLTRSAVERLGPSR